MSDPNGVPILGSRQHNLDGGQEHAVELSTTDGGTHVVAFTFQAPQTPDGMIDLSAARDFNGEQAAMTAIGQQVAMAQLDKAPPNQRPPVAVPAFGGSMVVLVHVVAFRYLGKVTAKETGKIVVERPDGTSYLHFPHAADHFNSEIGDLG